MLATAFDKVAGLRKEQPIGLDKMIYDILILFRTCLRILASSVEAKCSITEHAKNRSAPASTPRDLSVPITRLLQIFITAYTPGKGPTGETSDSSVHHASILEGMLHLLLTRAGELLNIIAFSVDERDDLANDSATTGKDTSPARIRTRATTASSTIKSTSSPKTLAAQAEGKCLLPLLKLLLPGTVHEQYFVDDAIVPTPKGDAARNVPYPKRSLVAKPLRKIQNTLVRGLFGDDAGVGDDILCLPTLFGLVEAGGVEVEVEVDADADGVRDDFVREMWMRVGWDVLGRNEALTKGLSG